MAVLSHTLGFPRIGVFRELKKSLEKYWNGKLSKCQLLDVGRQLRIRHWQQQLDSGIDLLPVGDFAWYDHVLTTSLMLGNIPKRHCNHTKDNLSIDTMFRIARGFSQCNKLLISAADMTKWFNTNYHYIVPEFHYGQSFQLKWMQLLDEVDEALSLGYRIKPVLLGPLTYLWLGKVHGDNFDKLCLLRSLLPVYREILEKLSQKGIVWVQIDEPILVLELSHEWQDAFYYAYLTLVDQVQILLTTYFDTIHHLISLIKEIPIQGIHVDCTVGNDNYLEFIHNNIPSNWLLSAGIINGRNVWRADLYSCFKKLFFLLNSRELWVGSSCSLLHSPIDLCMEEILDENIKYKLSFAIQKCNELFMLCTALNNIQDNDYLYKLKEYSEFNDSKLDYYVIHDEVVENRVKDISCTNINNHCRNSAYKVRYDIQLKRYNLPILPATTIGSFPQTEEIRKIRLDFKCGNLSVDNYYIAIKDYIKRVISEQENIGLDVLVHGEPERGDMVEYFGEQMNGFVFTQNGWVQSYGSRCVKPPIILGDISRKNNESITVKWIEYAQSLTSKPVKGILTGPVTILQWSFSREDISYETIALQLALAIRDEVMDLENAGIGIIQIDEPALREGLPLKKSLWSEYLNWAINSFKISYSLVKNSTQIHTHMCYSEFDDIIDAIIALDVDVITIEASRSDNKLLEFFGKISNFSAIGPGVYNIHSPYVPDEHYFFGRILRMLDFVKIEYLWVNPDCGLKTRSWVETIKSLSNMVVATKKVRQSIISKCK